MKSKLSNRWAMILLTPIITLATALSAASPPIPITADEAFDAVTEQVDPLEGDHAIVTLVDVRDPVEIFFSGAPGAVDQIKLLDGRTITPDGGKVHLINEGKFIEYYREGRYGRTQVAKIDDLQITQLSVNIPYLFRNAGGWEKNVNFLDELDKLYIEDDAGKQVLILFCRTGGRSSSAAKEYETTGPVLFDEIYEIDDDPESQTGELGGGVGGFTGSNYKTYKTDPTYMGAYNGHVGFPGRQTDIEEHPSVSWMDAGLPIVTTTKPNTP